MNISGTDLEKRVFREFAQQYDPAEKIDFNIDIKKDKNHIQLLDQNNKIFETFIPNSYNIVTDEKERLYIYEYFRNFFKRDLNWGILTGVKPVKLYRKIKQLGLNPDQILIDHFKLNKDKVDLLRSINNLQEPYLNELNYNNHISIYLGIPICPQKCNYCSFVSTVIDKKRSLVTTYLDNLNREIDKTAEIVEKYNLKIDTFYVGGGTPSILTPNEADKLLNRVNSSFNFNHLKEFTYEAGRPDTTSRELLDVLKTHNINRICLNPQTMNQNTLVEINRNHSVDQIYEKYKLIKDMGFNSTNMDLIVGLGKESEGDFLNSLNKVIELNPENLTVHNLSIKRGSYLNALNGKELIKNYSDSFFKEVQNKLSENNYKPYYLYRQKYTLGNGENVGYTKPGKESLYNILMMAEEQTILGIGAGSSGKLYDNSIDRFSHVFTVKDVRTYNNRTEEIINKKIEDYVNFFDKLENS